MPKVVESKLIFKGEDMLSPKLEHIIDVLERLGSTVEKVSERLSRLGEGGFGGGGGRGGGAGPKDGVGKAARGSGRADGTATGGGYFRHGKVQPYWGERGGLGFAAGVGGQLMGTASAALGAASHQLTPVAGGMLMSAGGAMMGNLLTAIPGAGLMAAGGLMSMTANLVQPALQHYEQFGGAYRRLGANRAAEARAIGHETKAFTPAEAIQTADQLAKIGAYKGYGVVAGMKYGGFAPETMLPFFTAATRAGAAGGREKSNYEFLGKVIGRQFSRDSELPSMTQAIEKMTGLMGMSEQYLSDISDDQTKTLAVWTGWTEKSGSAMLKGDRGVKTAGALWSAVSQRGEPATEMMLWQLTGKGKSPYEWMKYREEGLAGGAVEDMLGGLAGMKDRRSAAMVLSSLTKGQLGFGQSEKMLDEWEKGGSAREKATQQWKDLQKEKIEFAPGRIKADEVESMQKDLANRRLQLAENENILDAYKEFETEFTKMAQKMFENGSLVTDALKALQIGLEAVVKMLSGSGDEGRRKAAAWAGETEPGRVYGPFGTSLPNRPLTREEARSRNAY